MNEVRLKKDVIELKTLSFDEVNKLYELIDKNRDYMGEWLIWVEKIKSVEDIEKMMQEWSKGREKGEKIHFGLLHQDKLVGVFYFGFINKDFRKGSIGYWLDNDYQGQGIMTKSCNLLIEYGFGDLNLHRVEISCAEGNTKSRAIPERLGFKQEGIFKEA